MLSLPEERDDSRSLILCTLNRVTRLHKISPFKEIMFVTRLRENRLTRAANNAIQVVWPWYGTGTE